MKRKPVVLSVFLVALIALLAVVPSMAAGTVAPGRYVISIPDDKKLIVREKATSASDAIDYLFNGDTVEIVATDGSWAKIRQNGKFGWCSAKYATLQKEYACSLLLADVSTAACSAVDFAALKKNGVEGVLLRLGVSANEASIVAVDAKFSDYYIAAKATGLHVGAYFSSSAVTSAQVIKEYEWVAEFLKNNSIAPDLPVFFRPATAAQKSLSSAEMTLLVRAFCAHLEKNNYAAGVYLPADWTSKNINFDELGEYAHWIADFGDYCNFTKSYDIWQYSDASDFDGVTGKIGLSYMFTNLVQSTPTPPTDPAETDPPPTEPPEEKTTLPEQPLPEQHKEGAFTVVKQPGCSTCGEEAAYCTDCGKLLHTRLIAPNGHKDGDWVVTMEPGSNTHGTAVKYCTVCGAATKMQELCPTESKHIHTLGAWSYIDALTDGKLNQIPPEEGTTAENGAEKPTRRYACTVDREKTLVCTECGQVVVRYADLPQAHEAAADKKVTRGDCEKDGHEQTVCRECGCVMEDVITPAAGHSVSAWTVTKQPTASMTGEKQGVCAICHQTVTVEIPLLTGLPGDVNADGKVTSADARLVLRVCARLEKFADPEAARLADMDANGRVTAADARLILRKAARLD